MKNLTLVAPKPDMILKSNDKFFLAVASKTLSNLTYVYTLFCMGDGKGGYIAKAEADIAQFGNLQKAKKYEDAVRTMMDFQHKSKMWQYLNGFNIKKVKEFNEQLR